MFFGLFEIIPLALVGAILIALFAGRSEPDPDRERPTALYLSIVSFFAVLFVVGASFALSTGVIGLTGDGTDHASFSVGTSGEVGEVGRISEGGSREYRPHRNHDDDVSMIVAGLIAGAIALGVHRSYLTRIKELGRSSTGPGARVLSRYGYTVSFLTLLTGLGAVGVMLHAFIGLFSPDTFGIYSNADAARALAESAFVALVALWLFRVHSGLAESMTSPPRSVGFAPPAPPPAPPAAPAAKKAPAKKVAAKKAAR